MGRAELITQVKEFFDIHTDVVHDFADVPARNFAVKLAHQSNAFFPS
jgi:hypothetical protein